MLEMEALGFIRALSATPVFLNAEGRRHQLAVSPQLGSTAPWAAVSGGTVEEDASVTGSSGNWILNIMRFGSLRKVRDKKETDDIERKPTLGSEREELDGDRAEGCSVDETEDRVEFDCDSFSRLLVRVSMAETEFYAKMAYLCNLAYSIPKIEPINLLKYHGLRFIISSLEKKGHSFIAQNSSTSDQLRHSAEPAPTLELEADETWKETGAWFSTSVAYLLSFTERISPFLPRKMKNCEDSSNAVSSNEHEPTVRSSEFTSFLALKDSVTAIVDGKELLNAPELNSVCSSSSPCEWFICDDDRSGTRYFVIQGSESLASWQVNLLFEPIQFEETEALVHRGIYEAAKLIYPQILPEIKSHLKSHEANATFRFAGHSLGGSLALLLNLMLLIRRDLPPPSLLPVITFGSPSIMCGGDLLLSKLRLSNSHIQAIVMHRDIVPRAFSCHCPQHFANILKVLNGNFRNHTCLKNQNLLYAPVGKLLILQPEEKYSPRHHLLPPGCGLYLLGHVFVETEDSVKTLQAAQSAFLNSPHPLEVLSDRSAYGSKGTVFRDHDPNAYLRSMLSMIRQELKVIRKVCKNHKCFPLASM